MTRRRSLRSRLLLGAMLWTVGLLTLSAFGTLHGLLRYDQLHHIVFRAFMGHMLLFLGVGVACLVGGAVYVRTGLSSIDGLRRDLTEVRHGHQPRLDGTYPTEVQPLADDLNVLLDHRERTVARAVAKAGDLAHGLKTPLAVLAQEAERAEQDGHAELATVMRAQVERMQRQVDYHLAHARAAASGATLGARCAVRDSVDGLARTLLHLHAARRLAIDVAVPPEHAVRGQREDLDEMLGNLLDNACKWARTRISVTSTTADGYVAIVIDDDGPGLAASLREAVLQRGVRADEAEPGSGFGLAIVRDLAEVYGGSIALSAAPSGGLRATLRLPAA